MDQKRLGKRIKAFRKLKRFTQLDFAEKLGVPIADLGAVERGTKIIDDELLTSIVNTLEISREELLLEHEYSKEEQ